MMRREELVILGSSAVLMAVIGGFALLYFFMALSTGVLDVLYFCLIWLAFAGTVRLPAAMAYPLSAFLGTLLLFPLSLFLHLSANGGVRILGSEGFQAMIDSPLFPVWLIAYAVALCVAQVAARSLSRELTTRLR